MGGTSQSPGLQGTSGSTSGSGQGSTSNQGSLAETARQAAQSAGGAVSSAAEQVQNRAGEVYEQATEWARDTYRDAANWASDQSEGGSRQLAGARRSLPSGRGSGQSVQRFVSENPVLVGVVGLAAGLILGALLPRTRQEDRTLGRWSDEVRDQGLRYARDMTQRGREYVEQAFSDEDAEFDDSRGERPRDDQRRSGPSGRYQNH